MAIFDPLARVNSLIGSPVPRRRAASTITLTPEQESSLTGRVGSSALGGLSAVGNFIDLVDLGSSVRDILAGENPIDQFLTPFSPENRTTGRQLLRKHGLIGKQDTTGNFWGGLAAEVASSPLSYMSFGSGAIAKGTGGAVAKAAGLLPDAAKALASKTGRLASKVGSAEARVGTTLRDVIKEGGMQAARKAADAAKEQGVKLSKVADQPLGGIAGYGLPFMDPIGVLGTGARAQKVARGMDTAARAVKFAKIPGTNFQPVNSLARLFDSTIQGAKTAVGQTAARQLFRAREGARAGVGMTASKFADDMVKAGWGDAAQADKFRSMLEKVTETAPELQSTVDEITGSLATTLKELNRRGISTNEYVDKAMAHFPRYLAETSRRFSGKSSQVFSAGIPSRIGRKRFLFGIKGGTEATKKIIKDSDLNKIIDEGGTLKELAEAVKSKYGSIIPEKYLTKGGAERSTPKAIANWLRSLSKETRAAGVFGNHPLWDFKAYMEHASDAMTSIDTVIDTLAQPGILNKASNAARTEGTVTLGWLGRRLKVNKGDATQGFAQELMRKMGMGPLLENPESAQGIINAVGRYRISKDLAEDLIRFRKGMDAPEAANEIVGAIDSVTNLFKSMVTSLAPAFHSRNLVSGQFQNLIAGTFSARSVRDAAKLLRGGVVKGAKDIPAVKAWARSQGIANLTDETASQLLGQIAAGHKVLGKFEGEAASTVGSQMSGSSLDDLLSAIPGRRPVTAGGIVKRGLARTPETTWNPLAMRGVGGRLETGFGPGAAGQDIGHLVEGLNRLSPFIHQLRQGIDAGAAAAKVGAAQVMYQGKYYTKFESELLTRAFPFYKFARGQIPFTLRELATKPGGRMAQTIRAMNRSRNPDEMTPDYVAETASIPLGQQPDGSNRYVTGLGLMFEDPIQFAPLMAGDARSAGLEALSRMNPLIKAPIEWATGESFFQRGPMGGRDIGDIDPTIGRTLSNLTGQEKPVTFPGSQALEFTAANSPLARVLTSARQASDPRKDWLTKGLNLGTGVRVTDVSPGSQDAILRERAAAIMKDLGAKSFMRTYFPAEEIAQLPPEQQIEALRLQALMNTLAKRAKERKRLASKPQMFGD